MTRNLIYSCVFFNEKYIYLIKLLIISYKFFGNISNTDYLIICNPQFKNKIQSIYNNLNLNGKIWCLDLKNKFESCWFRLRIFNYPNINLYNKILYLDSDIIISGSLNKIFNFQMKEIIYTYDDEDDNHGGKNISNWGHGEIIFKKFNKPYNPKQIVFSSGIMCFLNTQKLKKLFENVINDIKYLCPNNIYKLNGTYDQDFIIYQGVINNMYDVKKFKKYCKNNSKIYKKELILNHFCAPVGSADGKLIKMNKFMNNIIFSVQENNIINKLIDYKNLDKYIINIFKQILKRKPTNSEFLIFNKMIQRGKKLDWINQNFRDIIKINTLINKKYKWNNSTIIFLQDYKMKALGHGNYQFIDNYLVKCNFGKRQHLLKFNKDYSKFISIRKGDFNIVNGNIL